MRATPLDDADDCDHSATLIEAGLDRNGNGRLDDGEVTSAIIVCDPPPEEGRGCSAAGTPTSLPAGLVLLLGGLLLTHRRRRQAC